MEIPDIQPGPTEPQAAAAVVGSSRLTPVSAAERIGVIDILRGLALFGILAANMRAFNAPFEVYGNIWKLFPGTADQIAQGAIDVLITVKAMTLFSFLFGLGFAVQMSRAEERGRPVSFYPRRLGILLAIGLIHAWLIWVGDILVLYALTGFILFLFRKRTQKTVAIWAISLGCLPLVIVTGGMIAARFGLLPPSKPDDAAKIAADIQSSIQVFRDGSYWAMAVRRFHDWVDANRALPFEIPLLALPRFLAGLWIWRSGLLKDSARYMPVVKRVMAWGLCIGLAGSIITLALRILYRGAPIRFGTAQFAVGALAFVVGPISQAAFYAGAVLMLAQIPKWRAWLTPFGAVGQMALTNYLTQSIFFVAFYRLTHTFGSVGPALGLVPTVIFFAIQIWFSVWWLQRFQFGPAEWAWRSLTYGVRQPMRRSDEHLLYNVAGNVG
ncbi:MAG: DUF418 domain-containing protein [Bryobacteraceae bacterium]